MLFPSKIICWFFFEKLFSLKKKSSLSGCFTWSLKNLPFWGRVTAKLAQDLGFFGSLFQSWALTSWLWYPSLDMALWVCVHLGPSLSPRSNGAESGKWQWTEGAQVRIWVPLENCITEWFDYFKPLVVDFTSISLILKAITFILKLDKVFLQVHSFPKMEKWFSVTSNSYNILFLLIPMLNLGCFEQVATLISQS